MDSSNPFAKEPRTTKEFLEHTAHWLTVIESEKLVSKQRVEHDLWRGRVKKCWVALEESQKEWKSQDTMSFLWSDRFNGQSFVEKVRYLHKTTKEYYDHLELYAK